MFSLENKIGTSGQLFYENFLFFVDNKEQYPYSYFSLLRE